MSAHPLEGLEQRIEAAISSFEADGGHSWNQVEDALTEGYGQLLALEAISIRLGRQLAQPAPSADNGATAGERRELEEFRGTVLADAARLRQNLRRFKARGFEARGRFHRPPG